MKFDVVLLADVFEKFRNRSFKNYEFCLRHYLSAPALSWDVVYIWQKLSLILFQIPPYICSLKKGMRDGVSYIFKIYSKANIKYLKFYNPKQVSKHIIYLDANNLYGYALSKFLPTSWFKWTDPKEFDFNKYTRSSSKGCVLEVDL